MQSFTIILNRFHVIHCRYMYQMYPVFLGVNAKACAVHDCMPEIHWQASGCRQQIMYHLTHSQGREVGATEGTTCILSINTTQLFYLVRYTDVTAISFCFFISYIDTDPSAFNHPFPPGSKVHGANMGLIWVRQPHVGPINFAIWAYTAGLFFQ